MSSEIVALEAEEDKRGQGSSDAKTIGVNIYSPTSASPTVAKKVSVSIFSFDEISPKLSKKDKTFSPVAIKVFKKRNNRPNCFCDMSDELIAVLHITKTYSMFSVLISDQFRDKILAGGLDVSTFKTNNQNGDMSEKPYKHPLMDV